MSLKENIVRLMKEKEITIKELAAKTDISEATLKKLRTQSCNPTLDVLIKLAGAFNISLTELVADKQSLPVFYQDNEIPPASYQKEFIFVFVRDTFVFKNGTKAVFRKYKSGDTVTKYIVYKSKVIMEKIKDDELLFKDEHQNLFSIEEQYISAVIIKQLYEVTYG